DVSGPPFRLVGGGGPRWFNRPVQRWGLTKIQPLHILLPITRRLPFRERTCRSCRAIHRSIRPASVRGELPFRFLYLFGRRFRPVVQIRSPVSDSVESMPCRRPHGSRFLASRAGTNSLCRFRPLRGVIW